MKSPIPGKANVTQIIVKLFISSFLLAIIIYVAGSISATNLWSIPLAILILGLISWLSQPFFDFAVKKTGLPGVILAGFFAYSVVVYYALKITPGIEIDSFSAGIFAAWAFAFLLTIVDWAFLSSANEVLVTEAVKHAQKHMGDKSDKTGFVFVQLDGVSFDVADLQMRAGNLNNLAKLIKEQDYELLQWNVQLPSTTPASQAGILIGSNKGIPAFRWFDKKKNKLVVANQVSGAAYIEKTLSNGKGLLADGGVSVGNLFTGDAEQSIMVISRLGSQGRSLKEMSKYSNYFMTPYGFMRSFILSIGEMVKELYQSQKQKRLNFEPRVKRKLDYVFLRAVTNVLLRDLQTNIVIDQMMRGKNSIYVDYLDYDEVAHHAGIARPESIQSLIGLDGVIGSLFAAKDFAPRPYEIVILSDHGQSQGPTFKQLHNGKNLANIVDEICGGVSISHDEVESTISDSEVTSNADSEIVITGSGNLGNVWLKSIKGRATKEKIEKKYPDLIKKLSGVNGIGPMIISGNIDQYIVIFKNKTYDLDKDKKAINKVLAVYDNLKTEDLMHLASNINAPDIAIISDINEQTGEVYAFEELVGNHGGAGGWQRNAMLLKPKKLKIDKKTPGDSQINGAENIHNIFIEWLEKSGQRKNLN